jgi:hypothetical protein
MTAYKAQPMRRNSSWINPSLVVNGDSEQVIVATLTVELPDMSALKRTMKSLPYDTIVLGELNDKYRDRIAGSETSSRNVRP